MKGKVAFVSLGCKVNQYETNAMSQEFIKAGYEVVEFTDIADIYIVNTCTVTNIADRKSTDKLIPNTDLIYSCINLKTLVNNETNKYLIHVDVTNPVKYTVELEKVDSVQNP